MKSLKLLWVACGAVMISVCSCSSSDEPDQEPDQEVGVNVDSRAQERQQLLQSEFLQNKGGLLLSAGATEKSGVYDKDKLYWLMVDLFIEPVDADSGFIIGPPGFDMPLYVMQVRGCEPVVPFVGVSYDDVNSNRCAYPLVAEGGVVEFPVVKLPSGTLSLADYKLDGVYVNPGGTERVYFYLEGFREDGACGEYIAQFVDNGGEKRVEIRENKTEKKRSFVLQFTNPSCEYKYDNGENTIFIELEQEAASAGK